MGLEFGIGTRTAIGTHHGVFTAHVGPNPFQANLAGRFEKEEPPSGALTVAITSESGSLGG